MNFDWQVFLFGIVVFTIFSIGFLIAYAAAAAEEAEHERGLVARLTLQICQRLGIVESESKSERKEP